MAFHVNLEAFPADTSRQSLFQLAQAAHTAGRNDDAFQFMAALVRSIPSGDITEAELHSLLTTSGDAIRTRRLAWRSLGASPLGLQALEIYRGQIAAELKKIAEDVLTLLDTVLLADAGSADAPSRVDHLRMKGDAQAVLAETSPGQGYEQRAIESYQQALEQAESSLPATHPIRLGVVFNYAVCQYEILKNQKNACELAKRAFDEAVSKLDQLDEASYKDTTLILQLLRDNLDAWTARN